MPNLYLWAYSPSYGEIDIPEILEYWVKLHQSFSKHGWSMQATLNLQINDSTRILIQALIVSKKENSRKDILKILT